MIKIAMIASENDAIQGGKVGGIADVIRDVPKHLAKHDVEVDVIIPGYQRFSTLPSSTLVTEFEVPFGGKLETVSLFSLPQQSQPKVNQWVLESPIFAKCGEGAIYCHDDEYNPFATDATKFALFSAAVCKLLSSFWANRVDVLHLHDWHAGFVNILRFNDPAYFQLQSIHTVFSMHNLGLQGIRPFHGVESSLESWFPTLNYDRTLIQDPRYSDCFNPMRAGITMSDVVHVVSPNYATEIIKPSEPTIGFIGGEGLELDLQACKQQGKLVGIINGCNYADETTAVSNFVKLLTDATAVVEKWSEKQNKPVHTLALQRIETILSHPYEYAGPLITSVGRLTAQKVSLLLEPYGDTTVMGALISHLEDVGGLMIFVGSGDQALEMSFKELMQNHKNFLFLNGYDESIPPQVYALGDLFLMPSSYEPCGISQMLAMRDGQPCLVHQIGGLKDTVKHNETGFVFSGANLEEITHNFVSVFEETISLLLNNKEGWATISANAKNQRFDWGASIDKYMTDLYKVKL